jgi:transposase-like protein
MPMLSYLQRFNVDTCHTSIHTLRWKDRLLQCPRCQSQDVAPWGNDPYRPGCKRDWCNGCQRTVNDVTKTLLHQRKRSLSHGLLATFLLCLACLSRRIASEVGVSIRTSDRWCGWLRNAALSYELQRQLQPQVFHDVVDFDGIPIQTRIGDKAQAAVLSQSSILGVKSKNWLSEIQ